LKNRIVVATAALAVVVLSIAGCFQQTTVDSIACIEADPTLGYAPLTVTLDASCSVVGLQSPPPEADYYFLWWFDDGSPGGEVGTAVEHTFAEPGTYQVRTALYETAGGGIPEDQATRTITVLPTE